MNKEKYFEGVKEYKLLAKHEVGQNFLVDSEIAKKVVDLLGISEKDTILEIGPGAGSLSVFLADYPNDSYLVDIDEALIAKLQKDFGDCPNVHPVLGNALKYDAAPFTKVIGNLPYYITTSLLETVLLEATSCRKAVLMVQKEAYARIAAQIGQDSYGPLPILIRYLSDCKRALSVPRSAFLPAPHIDSVVFTLDFKEGVNREEAKKLYRLMNRLFLHRRKTIYNNLTSYLGDGEKAKETLSSCGILPSKRPEELTLQDYLNLSQRMNG